MGQGSVAKELAKTLHVLGEGGAEVVFDAIQPWFDKQQGDESAEGVEESLNEPGGAEVPFVEKAGEGGSTKVGDPGDSFEVGGDMVVVIFFAILFEGVVGEGFEGARVEGVGGSLDDF